MTTHGFEEERLKNQTFRVGISESFLTPLVHRIHKNQSCPERIYQSIPTYFGEFKLSNKSSLGRNKNVDV